MKNIIDRLKYKKETIADPLYENPYSFGKVLTDTSKCIGCGLCKAQCVVGAIELISDKASCDFRKCIFCKNCIDICKKGALSMSNDYKLAEVMELGGQLKESIYKKFNRSLTLRSVDAGSCNACMLELSYSQNTYYDLSRFGVHFAASPRHADGIVVTGPVAINMKEALIKTYEAMAEPRLVIAVGTCAYDGGIFKEGYGNYDSLSNILPVDLVIPGCPPSPQAVIYGLLKLMDRI